MTKAYFIDVLVIVSKAKLEHLSNYRLLKINV